MDIINRNFLAIVSAGAFGVEVEIEKMSAYKWKILFEYAGTHNILPYVYRGYENGNYEQMYHIPQGLIQEVKNYHSKILSLPYSESKLTNMWLSKRLEIVRYNERHSIDTSVETLYLLNIIVYNTTTFLDHGVILREIIDLGIYLRTKGDKIDFVKLDKWLRYLYIDKMAQLQGSILVSVFDFDIEEIPFVSKVSSDAYSLTLKSIDQIGRKPKSESYISKNINRLAYISPVSIKQSLNMTLRYLPYSPLETFSHFVYKFYKSISDLEE